MRFLHRLGINRYILENWKRYGFTSSWKLKKRVKSGSRSNVVAFKGTAVSIDPTVSIYIGTARLVINDSWFEVNPFNTSFVMRRYSRLIVHGAFTFYSNADISVNENATLELGSGFINHGARIHCFKSIKIGDHVYIGDDVAIRDCDGHEIIGSDKPMTMPIVIEDHVWIGAKVTILKGVTVGEGSVVAAGSVVSRDVPPHTLVAGVPAKVVKENVSWQ